MKNIQVLAVIPSIDGQQISKLESLYCALQGIDGVVPIIMSNGSTLTQQLIDRDLNYLSQSLNPGFGQCVTYAAHLDRNWDWLMIVNDDIEILDEIFADNVRAMLISDRHTSADIIYFDTDRERSVPNLLTTFMQMSLLDAAIGKRLKIKEVDGPKYRSFSCVAIRRELWENLEGFDANLPFTFEDADFVRRADAVGPTSTFLSISGLRHLHSVSSGKYVRQVLPVSAYSAAKYLDKWYGRPFRNTSLLTLALVVRVLGVPFTKSKTKPHLAGTIRAIPSVWLRNRVRPELPKYESL